MKYKKYLLVAAALVVIGATSIKPAMAYFTNSHQAVGTVTVHLGDLEITPNEDAKEWTKEITVQNTGDYDVFVRVKAICGSQYSASLTSGDGWSYNNDGYYYYSDLLKKDATSSVLKLTITPPEGLENEEFNVVIVQEAAKAVDEKDADGNKTGKLVAAWDEAIMQQDKFKAKFQDDTTAPTESTSEGGNN